jgi:hypothetical protein
MPLPARLELSEFALATRSCNSESEYPGFADPIPKPFDKSPIELESRALTAAAAF